MCPQMRWHKFPGTTYERGNMKRELTDVYLESLMSPETGRIELGDARVSGLVLRMTPSGAATWSIRARTKDGKQTRRSCPLAWCRCVSSEQRWLHIQSASAGILTMGSSLSGAMVARVM